VRLRPGTIALAAAVKYKYNIPVVPHILCGGFTKEETENVLIEMKFLESTMSLPLGEIRSGAAVHSYPRKRVIAILSNLFSK